MHNGSLFNLSQVIDHYADLESSLFNYDASFILDFYKYNYNGMLYVEKRKNIIEDIYNSAMPVVKRGFDITEEEKRNLILFLEKSLTDYSFYRR